MGCKCCIPAALNVAPEVYAGEAGLPAGIIHVNERSSQTLQDEFARLIGMSFCGSTGTAPEGALSWVFDPKSSGDNPSGPLLEEPSAARVRFFEALGKFISIQGIRHGGCFALRDESEKLVAATVTIPPNKKNLHHMGGCEQWYVMNQMGGMSAMPPELTSGPSEKRSGLLEKTMLQSHKSHASGEHLYVFAFATALGEQGKGYGRKLMEFLVASADRMNVPAYLECSGAKNERFYNNNGYQLKQRYPIEFQGDSFKPDGLDGMAAMVYKKV